MGGDVVGRIIGAAVGFGAAKLAAKGVTLSPEAQTAVAIGVYGVTHRLWGWVKARAGQR